jgi:hypothetical protein
MAVAGQRTYLRENATAVVELPEWVKAVTENRVYARLRHLRQLGLVVSQFPSATHTRFAHSLGVAHLARELLCALDRAHGPALGLTAGDVNTVVFAALCHDLGHGPCSHAFEQFMAAVHPELHWTHEQQSLLMMDYMLDMDGGALRAHVEAHGVDVRAAQAMIRGDAAAAPPDQHFQFAKVDHSTSGMDVDKWDYLARDGAATVSGVAVNTSALLRSARVVRDGAGRTCIAWPHTLSIDVMGVFAARQTLHAVVIAHPRARAAEFMALTALRHLARYPVPGSDVSIADAHAHPAVFATLTDVLLDCGTTGWLAPPPAALGMHADYECACELFRRISSRQLLRFCGEVSVSLLDAAECGVVDSAGAVAAELAARAGVGVDAVTVHIAVSSCGKGKLNPVDLVPFFHEVAPGSRGAGAALTSPAVLDADYDLRSEHAERAIVAPAAVHYSRPAVCEIRKLLVFVDRKPQQEAVKAALHAWALDHGVHVPPTAP